MLKILYFLKKLLFFFLNPPNHKFVMPKKIMPKLKPFTAFLILKKLALKCIFLRGNFEAHLCFEMHFLREQLFQFLIYGC